MSDEPSEIPDEVEPEETETPETDEPEDDWTPPDREAWEKLRAKAERREAKLRDAQAELAKLRGEQEQTPEPSEADTLRTGLVRTEGRAILAASGITDRKDQAAVLDAIRLDGIEVDEAGDVDADELEKRITALRRILAPAPSGKPLRPRVSTRDQGGRDATPADPDAARYARIMGAR